MPPTRHPFHTAAGKPRAGSALSRPQLRETQNRKTAYRSLLPTRNQSAIQWFIPWGKFVRVPRTCVTRAAIIAFVPTQAMLNGGFTQFESADPPPDGGGGYYRSANYVINDDVSWVRGHQMTFVGFAWQGRVTSRNDFASNAQFTFSGAVTGQGVGDFLTGNASNFVGGPPKPLARCSSP